MENGKVKEDGNREKLLMVMYQVKELAKQDVENLKFEESKANQGELPADILYGDKYGNFYISNEDSFLEPWSP